MASIEYRTKSTRVIAYVNKEKQVFPLGRVTKKTAERFANNIDTLLHERRCNLPISREVSNWLADLDDDAVRPAGRPGTGRAESQGRHAGHVHRRLHCRSL